jgi:two-component system phosphate regulon response regulator OmpR
MAEPAETLPDDAPHLLVVDDDRRIRDLLSRFLFAEGYRVTTAGSASEARAKLGSLSFDLLVLDVMMPGETGFDLAKSLRTTSSVPILMLTAKAETESRIAGLELGADDYVSKPFSPKELIARVRAVLRRARPEMPGRVLREGTIVLDPERHVVLVADTPVNLTPKEFDLLHVFMEAAGRVLGREHLLTRVWGYAHADEIESRTVDVHVRRLRTKLGAEGRRISTVKTVGYRFDRDMPC